MRRSRSHRANPAGRMSRRAAARRRAAGETLPIVAAVGEDVRWTHAQPACEEGIREAIEAVFPQT
jgi:hypothetical protein